MAEVLMLNPKKRRTARKRKAAPRRAPRRAAARRSVRRRNPLPMFGRARRRVTRARRRRNPIGLKSITGSAIVNAFKDAMIGAAGAVAVGAIMARVNPMLPAALRKTGKVGAGDAVQMLLTIMLGRMLSGPTRGLSMKLASGALTVQAHGVLQSVLPAGFLADSQFGGLGYMTAGEVENGSMRVGPAIDGFDGMDAYTPGTMLLNEYTAGSGGELLNGLGEGDAFSREGVSAFR